MLDMGFLPDVRRILAQVPRERQTMLFSATMPPEIVQLSREFLQNPRMVHVDPTTVAAVGVAHLALPVPAHRKAALLRELLRDEAMSSVLVFARTKHRADRLSRQLSGWGFATSVIHGNRSQNQRIHALEGFRRGHHRVLVATDIAARGLDVEGVSHVVNFDVPHEPEAYIHRVGRTARAEHTGDAYTLLSPDEESDFARIESLLGFAIRRARIPGFDYNAPPPPRSEMPREGGRRPQGHGRRGPSRHRAGGRPVATPAQAPAGPVSDRQRRKYSRW